MNIGDLKRAFSDVSDPYFEFQFGFDQVVPFRGDFDQLALVKTDRPVSAKKVRELLIQSTSSIHDIPPNIERWYGDEARVNIISLPDDCCGSYDWQVEEFVRHMIGQFKTHRNTS